MSLNKIIIIFGVILVLFAAAVFYQFSSGSLKPHLPTTDVVIGDKTFQMEIAKTQKDQEIGLSGRSSLADDKGMVFVFDKPGYYPFWMRKMKISLDMIFVNNGKIVAIYDSVPPIKDTETEPLYGSDVQADRVLEINAGLSKKYFFNKGDTVKINL